MVYGFSNTIHDVLGSEKEIGSKHHLVNSCMATLAPLLKLCKWKCSFGPLKYNSPISMGKLETIRIIGLLE